MDYDAIDNDVTMPGNGRSLPGNRTINDAVTMPGNERALLANRYRVVKQLGQGGMGSVWLAEDMLLDNKQFAIKMLPSILVSNKRAYRQLKDEALVAMKLTHPNIVTLRAFEENNGNPFLVMDYIDGQSLDDYLGEKGTLSEEETVKLLKPIAAALDYAHTKGVVHRDVKPGNVMIAKDGTPYILDFGIAREIQETMTRVTGKLSSGTLLYMSPEQLHGAAPKKEQDIYSFAAMVYECLKGEPPFRRGQIEFQIDNDIPEPLPGGACAASIMSGLAKKPEDRPPTCAAVLEGGFSRAERAERVESDRGGALSNGSLGKVIGVLGIIIGAFGLGALLMSNRTGTPSKADDRTGAQSPIARQPDSKPVTRDVVSPVVSPKTGDKKSLTLPGGATMEMIYVEPGSFMMGSPTSEDGHADDETQHRVMLTKGFWLGKYEVTQKQWRSVMGDNPSYFKGDDRPVESVSWDDCQKFIAKVDSEARRQLGGGARLPTEAEWEYACRAGTTGAYAGRSLDAMGWYYDNSGLETHPVGQKQANALGFYDMHGNVWEWCSDWYGSDYYKNSPSVDPQGPASGDYRVFRGGGWGIIARNCRSAYRDWGGPGYRSSSLGFRVALAPSH